MQNNKYSWFRLRNIILFLFFTAFVLVSRDFYEFKKGMHFGKKSIDRINEKMTKGKLIISNLSNIFDCPWEKIKIDYDLFYQNVYIDLFFRENNTYKFSISTEYLWINEDYDPKSPAGKTFHKNDMFVFFKSNRKKYIIMETLNKNEELFCKKVEELLPCEDGNIIKLRKLFPFKWDELKIFRDQGYINFIFDKNKNPHLIFNIQLINPNILKDVYFPNNSCIIAKNDDGFLTLTFE